MGDDFLVLLQTNNQPLKAKFEGTYNIRRRISDLTYVVDTSDRKKKTERCHINMIKSCYRRTNDKPVFAIQKSYGDRHPKRKMEFYIDRDPLYKLQNSEILANLDSKLGHLSDTEKKELSTLISDYKCLFSQADKYSISRCRCRCRKCQTNKAISVQIESPKGKAHEGRNPIYVKKWNYRNIPKRMGFIRIGSKNLTSR